MRYEHEQIEPKWQAYWEQHKCFATHDSDVAGAPADKPKYYILDMFPYPSGAGLHVGHPEGYTATDIMARYKRMRGFNVLHPMGFDAFGLPAENYAIKTGIHPRITTADNINRIRAQIKRLGFAYDWDREVDTTAPDYYRWTQWIFLQLFKRGLAYEDTVPINWCPSCKTGLANEEVKNGRCDRCGQLVTRKGLRQWMLKITAYADQLLDGLTQLDWPDAIKKMQQDWIGRSTGADVYFELADAPADVNPKIVVYTTRPDTLFGASYLVLAPEHPLVPAITTAPQRETINAYVQAASHKSDLQRSELAKTKTGAFTGAYAINPVNQQKIPIWVADYVLAGYGTGAVMAVPAHDQRDYEFAKTFDLPMVCVVKPRNDTDADLSQSAFTDEGISTNSGAFNGLATTACKEKIVAWLSAHGAGQQSVRYKLRDWVFSRQRYWGEPIPLVHCRSCGVVPVPESALPVLLPEVERYEPTGTGESPLATVTSWVNTACPNCGGPGQRETNTMPQWAGSCWYYLRYIDPKNTNALVDPAKERQWMPVDLYVGGAEHAVLHLLYARFWHKVLFDLGLVSTAEPFAALRNQGMILGYSYRYLQDEAGLKYPTTEGILREDRWTLKSTKQEVMEKWVPTAEVKWEGEVPLHPQQPELVLEQFITKMSKARGNVVNPDDIIKEYGADVLRLYEMFLGPFEASCPWNTRDIEGVNRFLHRAWRLYGADRRGGADGGADDTTDSLKQLRHQTIQKVTEDIEAMAFNTAIAQLMTYVNEMTKLPTTHLADLHAFALLMSPLVPHWAEQVWEELGHKPSISQQAWPSYDPAIAARQVVTLVVQINGKKRETCEVGVNTAEADVLNLVRQVAQKHLQGMVIVKEIYVARSNLVNLVVKPEITGKKG